jgi:hypothetical protein
MGYKKNVSALLLALLISGGCTRTDALPYSPTLTQVGPDMQELMESLLAPRTTSVSTPHAATITGRNE